MVSPESADAPSAVIRRPRTAGAERPKTRMKGAQIRSDQWTNLDELARDLQDARTTKVERITANTLIRVALDGLLACGDRLYGDTEDELRKAWMAFLGEREAGDCPS